MKRKSVPVLALAVLVLWSLSPVTAQAGPIDDFLCYKATDKLSPAQDPPNVGLENPLFEPGIIPTDVKKAKEFCAPANKISNAFHDADVHLKRYRIKRLDGLKDTDNVQTVVWSDQFTGDVGAPLVLETRKSRDLMVPTTKSVCDAGSPENPGQVCALQQDCGGDRLCLGNPNLGDQKCRGNAPVNPGGPCTTEEDCGGITYCPTPVAPNPLDHDVDHFKCYKVKVDAAAGPRFPKDITTPVYDQFDSTGTRVVEVKKPFELCDPVDKNGEGIKDAARRLLCYKVKPVTDQGRALVANQFGIERLDIKNEKLLCVPAVWVPPSPSGAFLGVTSGVLD
jgi:hypothetical protein